ncbi:tail fiber assembly protein [Atlantibacter sp.]|uniref:tail fiber assembly protein n=1 Tax=Atlantibacter sp. TaxID=1903473 RepID=UPI0028A74ECB|nr:tail fiber assembly protein [Atlantibacter sp.]
MQIYLWSPSQNAFFPADMVSDYESAGWDVSDFIPVDDGIYAEYSAAPPEGKIRVASDEGLPAWVDIPPPSHDELVAIAEQKKKSLLAEAVTVTSMWRTELQLGIISDDDKASLTAWMIYNRELQGVDTDAAPDIEWPEKPQQQ